MKKNNLHLIFILAALITVILVSAIALIVMLTPASDGDGQTSAATTSQTQATTKNTTDSVVLFPHFTTPAPYTTPTPETTPQTPVTTPTPETTPQTPATTPAPETDEPITDAPSTSVADLKPISGTVKGDSISSLGIYASYATESIDQEARTMTVRFTFYVESYGLQVGGRTTNKLLVNGQKVGKVTTPKINLPDGSPHTRTVLYEYVVTVEKPDDTPVTLQVEFSWNSKIYYSKEYVEYLTVTADLTV
ncbi:MAG: hypothetical protein IJW62_00495 [Clostridia bacterium]|nr:hypothetical protein [Clostridia bacterium]